METNMTKALLRLAAALYITLNVVLYIVPSAHAQSVTEARFVLADIEKWLAGQFDNEAQRFVEAAFGAGTDGQHEWFHIDLKESEPGDGGSVRFLSTMKDRSNPASPPMFAVFAFRVDEDKRAVRMDRYRVPPENMNDGQLRASAIMTDGTCIVLPNAWNRMDSLRGLVLCPSSAVHPCARPSSDSHSVARSGRAALSSQSRLPRT